MLCPTEALEDWTHIVGSEFIQTDNEQLRAASTATFATQQKIAAILRPGNLAEVQDCVRTANRHRTPLYPISSGKNWATDRGYRRQTAARFSI
jgi:4-cresol dehydrogenase (hydroxylating)